MNIREFERTELPYKTWIPCSYWADAQWYYYDVQEWTDEGEIISVELIASCGKTIIKFESVEKCIDIANKFIKSTMEDFE